MKTLSLILFTCLSCICIAQTKFYIDEYVAFPDLKIKIGEETTLSDVKIKIGEDITFEDFTVKVTNKESEAHFIVVDSKFKADKTIKASENETLPDIRIKVGEGVTFPDVSIKIKASGKADYLVFSEKKDISTNEIVLAILPVINNKIDNKLEGIPTLE